MPNEVVSLSEEKKKLYEALGVEGVVDMILRLSGTARTETVKEASAWLRKKRKCLERRANLRFWIPQAIAILASVAAVIAAVIAVFAVSGG